MTPTDPARSGGRADAELAPIPADWQDPVAWERLEAVWTAYADQKELEEKRALALTLRTGRLLLEDQVRVVLEVINAVQIDQLDTVRTSLLDHLRRTLRNASLELDVRLAADRPQQETTRFLTDRERYALWAERYPALEQLRTALDLDWG